MISPFNPKAKQWIKGRRGWKQRIAQTKWRTGKRVWFHCASLGEFEQARPVIEKWGKDHPSDSIILTFFSPSGYEVRKHYEVATLVMYLPPDTISNARHFLELVRPDIALFVKYEFWYHYLCQLKERNITVILFSAVFRKEQAFFKWYGNLFRKMLATFKKILVQDSGSKKLLESISISSELNPDTRFDRVYEVAQKRPDISAIQKFKDGSKIFIAGSTWPKDDEMVINLIREQVLEGYKFIIAPHDVNTDRISALISGIPGSAKLLSELKDETALDTDVVVVDSIGQLSSLYAFADIAYVGGGFNTNVHNILEAAVYGIPVVFGPNYTRSIEAQELIEKGGAYSFSSYQQLTVLLANKQQAASSVALQNRTYVIERLGGSEKVCIAISQSLV